MVYIPRKYTDASLEENVEVMLDDLKCTLEKGDYYCIRHGSDRPGDDVLICNTADFPALFIKEEFDETLIGYIDRPFYNEIKTPQDVVNLLSEAMGYNVLSDQTDLKRKTFHDRLISLLSETTSYNVLSDQTELKKYIALVWDWNNTCQAHVYTSDDIREISLIDYYWGYYVNEYDDIEENLKYYDQGDWSGEYHGPNEEDWF